MIMKSSYAALVLAFLQSTSASGDDKECNFVCPRGTHVGSHVSCLDTLEDCFCDDTNDSAESRPQCWEQYLDGGSGGSGGYDGGSSVSGGYSGGGGGGGSNGGVYGNDSNYWFGFRGGYGGKFDDICSFLDDYSKCRTKYNPSQCYNHYHRKCDLGPNGFGGPYRHLKAVENTSALTESHGECLAKNYEMFLVMQGAHMMGLASPVEEETACPNFVFHSKVPIEGDMEKTVMTIEEEGVASIKDEEKLHLGVQPLSSIVAAFGNADVSKKNEKVYDAVTNNCVVLLRNMADPLDIAVDKRMINFVSKRLLSESGAHMIDLMKGSPALSAIVGSGGRFLKGVGAEEIVSKVIEMYV